MIRATLKTRSSRQPEFLAQDRIGSEPLLIFFFKVFRRDLAGSVDYENSRIRNSVVQRPRCDSCIQDPKRADHHGTLIRKKRESNLHAIGEILKDLAAV